MIVSGKGEIEFDKAIFLQDFAAFRQGEEHHLLHLNLEDMELWTITYEGPDNKKKVIRVKINILEA